MTRDWKTEVRSAGILAVCRSGPGSRLGVDGSVVGVDFAPPAMPPCDVFLFGDEPAAAHRLRASPKTGRVLVVGARRMLSIAHDGRLYEMAGEIAKRFWSDHARAMSGDLRSYDDEIVFALMHRLATPLRTYLEILELVETENVAEILLPLSAIAAARTLAVLLRRAGAPATADAGPPEQTLLRALGRPIPRARAVDVPAGTDILVLRPGKNSRSSKEDGWTRMREALSRRAVVAVADPEERLRWSARELSDVIRLLPACRRFFARHGFTGSLRLRLALRTSAFISHDLPHLLRKAENHRLTATLDGPMPLVASHTSRTDTLFALAGARRGGAMVFDVRTMLSTSGPRYGAFSWYRGFVPDEAQRRVLASAAAPGTSERFEAFGSTELAPWRDRLLEERRHRPNPRDVVVCTQPTALETESIFVCLAGVPHDVPIVIAPHPEDGEAVRTWFADRLARLGHPSARVAAVGSEPVRDASIVVTSTSNMAIRATSLGIPVILCAPRRALRDIWGEGPYPGLVVDTSLSDPVARFAEALRRAQAGETAADYVAENTEALFGDAAEAIADRITTVVKGRRMPPQNGCNSEKPTA